jgi:hypothetical protein
MAEKTKPKVAAAMLAELWPSEIQKIQKSSILINN